MIIPVIYKEQEFIPHCLEAGRFEVKAPVDKVSGKGCSLLPVAVGVCFPFFPVREASPGPSCSP